MEGDEGSSAGESASTLAVEGTDGTPGCANAGEKQRPWSLTGNIVKISSKTDEILIDFSPKGAEGRTEEPSREADGHGHLVPRRQRMEKVTMREKMFTCVKNRFVV